MSLGGGRLSVGSVSAILCVFRRVPERCVVTKSAPMRGEERRRCQSETAGGGICVLPIRKSMTIEEGARSLGNSNSDHRSWHVSIRLKHPCIHHSSGRSFGHHVHDSLLRGDCSSCDCVVLQMQEQRRHRSAGNTTFAISGVQAPYMYLAVPRSDMT